MSISQSVYFALLYLLGKPEIYCDSQLRSVASQIRDVSLSCQVLADPPPDISWSGGEDGRTSFTTLSEPNGLFNVIKGVTNTWSSTLYFSGHIMKSDSGVYTIVATNDYGTTMESIRLNVSSKYVHTYMYTCLCSFIN